MTQRRELVQERQPNDAQRRGPVRGRHGHGRGRHAASGQRVLPPPGGQRIDALPQCVRQHVDGAPRAGGHHSRRAQHGYAGLPGLVPGRLAALPTGQRPTLRQQPAGVPHHRRQREPPGGCPDFTMHDYRAAPRPWTWVRASCSRAARRFLTRPVPGTTTWTLTAAVRNAATTNQAAWGGACIGVMDTGNQTVSMRWMAHRKMVHVTKNDGGGGLRRPGHPLADSRLPGPSGCGCGSRTRTTATGTSSSPTTARTSSGNRLLRQDGLPGNREPDFLRADRHLG